MKEFLFASDRYFSIFDTIVSHGQLLIRAQKNEIELTNIDIVFYDTVFIQSCFLFNGLKIRILNRGQVPSYLLSEPSIMKNDNVVFELSDDKGTYFVVSSFFRIYKNELDFHETSLGYSIDKGEEIANSLD